MRFLVVSGPTREPLDPVRFLSNYSTGSMGRYLAETVKKRGHKLDWVRCPEMAETARDLHKLLKKKAPKCQALIMAAAVCDVRPADVSSKKIKKGGLRAIEFVPNPDILKELSVKKKPGQIYIGFALESANLIQNALDKLRAKKLEAIVLQEVTNKQHPFGDKKIEAYLIRKNGSRSRFAKVSKRRLAEAIVREAELMASQTK